MVQISWITDFLFHPSESVLGMIGMITKDLYVAFVYSGCPLPLLSLETWLYFMETFLLPLSNSAVLTFEWFIADLLLCIVPCAII